MNLFSAALAASALALPALVSGCAGGESGSDSVTARPSPVSSSTGADLTGAGASFPYPIYAKWVSEYAAKTGVKINYANLGSGAGIRQLMEQTVDFGATDAPMTDEEMAKAKGGPVLHIPTVLGAVVMTYNLPDVASPLNLSGEVVADIFLGRITKWNDARITSLNPGSALPAKDIIVVHRSDGSGTTFILSDFLSAVSPAWKSGPGKGKDLQWPVGLGGNQNPGVAGTVKQTQGAIGYVELAYARQNRLPTAAIKNAAGQFVLPTIESIAAAATNATEKLAASTDYRVSIVNAPGATSYPISSFTWLIIYKRQPDAAKGKKLVDFTKWMLHEGQIQAPTLDYAPIPASMIPTLYGVVGGISMGAP